jgi:TM2 domain-containing membrane protein YozV
MTQSDELFCEIGIDLGMLSRQQVQEAARAMDSAPAADAGRRIGSYLFAVKALDREQVGKILKMQARIEEARWARLGDGQAGGRSGARGAVTNPAADGVKTRTVYIILALVVGFFGIHNFYAGRSRTGIIQLLITAILGWAAIGLVITFIWALVDIVTVTTDGEGVPLG